MFFLNDMYYLFSMHACNRFVGKFIPRKDRMKEGGPTYRFTNVYVKNFGDEYQDTDLMNAFVSFGKILSAKVMIDTNTGKGRGFGFVSYDAHENASKVGVCNCVCVCVCTCYNGATIFPHLCGTPIPCFCVLL